MAEIKIEQKTDLAVVVNLFYYHYFLYFVIAAKIEKL
jgi:hypothetical protein